MSTLPKPESAFKKSVHAVEIGIALGVAGFILNALIAGEIAGLMFQSEEEHLAPQLLVLLLPAFILAPATAFAAGLVVEGPRWRIVVAQNLTLQLTIVLVPAVSVGLGEFFSAGVIAAEVGLIAAGTVLSGLAMGKAQQRKPKPSTPQASLAGIDFAKVKQEAAASAAQPAPTASASEAQPAAQPSPAPATPEAPATAAVPAAAPGDEPKT